ncbi:hypothetical protein [Ruania alba]|uniref:Uncharacterized protein n=1 Tax=Ruania alba TaxID=648782 RepID=A0A1H5MPY3_9MICO|nr:hypothetical protein [Ruania alba]SEE91200.1 hypothetical protein SAMN04488554_3538 [Ruania alba]
MSTTYTDNDHTDALVFTQDELDGETGFMPEQLDALADTVDEVEIARSTCIDIWVLKGCFEYARGEIDVRLYVLKQYIGGGTISRDRPEFCLGAGVGVAKAKVCARADFERDRLTVWGSACLRKWYGGWKCRSFRTTALTW